MKKYSELPTGDNDAPVLIHGNLAMYIEDNTLNIFPRIVQSKTSTADNTVMDDVQDLFNSTSENDFTKIYNGITSAIISMRKIFTELQITLSCSTGEANLVLSHNTKTPGLLESLKSLGNLEVTEGFENLSIIGDEINNNPQILEAVELLNQKNELDLFDTGPGHLSFLVAEKNGLHLMNALHQQIFRQCGG